MKTKEIVLSGMFLALGLLLPFLTMQIPQIGSMLLPMHIPVLLCGLICGPALGAIVGVITPILRNMLFGMPPMPGAIFMAAELLTYGLVIGLVYTKAKKKNTTAVYTSMLVAMLVGRVVWGIVKFLFVSSKGGAFTLPMFFAEAFTGAIPGIILQLVLIPAVMIALDKAGYIQFDK